MSEKETLYCSFCGKAGYEVRQLMAGPIALICDECTDLCVVIVAERRFETDPYAWRLPFEPGRLALQQQQGGEI